MDGIELKNFEPAMPSRMPTKPPAADRMKPSMMSASMMRSFDQPRADRMPISRVRSRTAMSSVLSTMSTPMNRATQAIALDTAVMSPNRLSLRSMPSLGDTVSLSKASTACETRSASALSPGLSNMIDRNVTAPVRKVSSCRSASGTIT